MYCKNCGSILQNNANFCHVCGTKVDVIDTFETKEEVIDEPKVEPTYQEPAYKSYYDSFDTYRRVEDDKPSNKPLVPALIGALGSLFIMGDAGLIYLSSMLQFNNYYSKGVIPYSQYIEYVVSTLKSVGMYLVLAAILGLVLGIVAVRFAKKQSHKKAFIFGILSVVLGAASCILAVLAFVFYFMYA